MEKVISALILLFKSWGMAATIKTWPHHTLWGELYRFLTQPFLAIFMGGKLSRSFDWIRIGHVEADVEVTKMVIMEHALDDLETVVLAPEPSAPHRGKTWWSMALAMIRWKKCVVLEPSVPYTEYRVGFSAQEERGLVQQYCAIVFKAGERVRVLKGPYTTKFFGIDIRGNIFPLTSQGGFDCLDRKVFAIPLI